MIFEKEHYHENEAPKRYWNHRVIRTEHKYNDGYVEVTYEIHEVHYENNEPNMWSEPVSICGYESEEMTGIESARWVLEKMMACLDKPVLMIDPNDETKLVEYKE